MDYLQNHCHSHHSIWGGSYYCKHVVSISSYEDQNLNDWNNIISDVTESVFSQAIFDRMKDAGTEMDDNTLRKYCTRKVNMVEDHVIDWLMENVADRPKPPKGQSSKGWAISSTESRVHAEFCMSFFFHRKSDAMAFIKQFSEYGKPVFYHQYFSDVQKKLNLSTRKYEMLQPSP